MLGCVSCLRMATSRMILAIREGLPPSWSFLMSLMATCTPPSCFQPSLTLPNSPSPMVLPRMYSPNLVCFSRRE